MPKSETLIGGGPIFDGVTLHHGMVAHFIGGRLTDIVPADRRDPTLGYIDLDGDILSPGYTDLQVNGGDGVMLNAAPTIDGIQRIAKAHRRLGTVQILPTLITDTPEKTAQVIEATIAAISNNVAGIAGLHLEGPHLDTVRKGAHDQSLIRPMTTQDMESLLRAAELLPLLKVTLAPENVRLDQVRTLAAAGVLVSLGHSNCSYETALDYAAAGATCVTHLFNAMSQLSNRAPGLVGAALTCPTLSAGMISDGIHVHSASLRTAWAAKGQHGPGQLFLVSDAMAPAGTTLSRFTLNGREVLRRDGRLTLEDGTLAGADLDLTTAVRILRDSCDLPLERALAGAVTAPRQLIGQWTNPPQITGTVQQDFIRIRPDLSSTTPLMGEGP